MNSFLDNMKQDKDLELHTFLGAVEDLSELREVLEGRYDSKKPYNPENNNPAATLSSALAGGYGPACTKGETFLDDMRYWDERFGTTHPFFHQLVEEVSEKFNLLERAVLDNMKWEDVRKIGGVSSHLEYLFRPPTSEQVMRRFVQSAFSDKAL